VIDLRQIGHGVAENQPSLRPSTEIISAQRVHFDIALDKSLSDVVEIKGCAGERSHMHAIEGRLRFQPFAEMLFEPC